MAQGRGLIGAGVAPLRVVFAGTPEFAAVALARILVAGHEVALVLTQPDRPAGRGLQLQASPVKQLALLHGLPVAQPRSLRLDGKYPEDALAAQQALLQANADVMVVAAYGLILPQWVLDLMAPTLFTSCTALPPEGAAPCLGRPGAAAVFSANKLGCLNIHASLLPRWRGAAPIHRAIEAGDTQTGVCIMQMDAGLDTGDVLLALREPIAPDDTTASLLGKLAALGAKALVDVLAQAQQGHLAAVPQAQEGITYAHKISKAEASVDWSQSASAIARKIRAFNPAPVACSTLQGESIKLYAAQVAMLDELDFGSAPRTLAVRNGEILQVKNGGIFVKCGENALQLTELQRPGGKRLPAGDFVRGFPLHAGQVWGA